MAGHSRSKNGVATARLCPAIHAFLAGGTKDVDARHKAGHDEFENKDAVLCQPPNFIQIHILMS
jgi:hypothetical protein